MMPLEINCIPVSNDVLVSVSAGTLGVKGMIGVAYKKIVHLPLFHSISL